ncbi:MAG: hypothetical protein N2558_04060 [Patescibacteria group bacterium]|nr:hypothetical protein [Patescibacteria group bacterium]
MPAKNILRVKNEGVILHVYNEGIEKKEIFPDEEDRNTFVKYLSEYLSPASEETTKKAFFVNGRTYLGKIRMPKNYYKKVALLCYCIKPKSFNLIVEQLSANSVERFVRSLCTRYSMYFNKKYARTGTLFRGPYKSIQINNSSDLYLLSRYLNSIDINHPKNSLAEYIGEKTTPWISTQKILNSISEDIQKAYAQYAFDIKQGFSNLEKERLKIIAPAENEIDSRNHSEETKNTNSEVCPADNSADIEVNSRSINTWSQNLRNNNRINIPIVRRTPELFFATIAFMVLFGIGMQNIRAQEYQQSTKNKIIDKEIIQINQNDAKHLSPTPSERDKIEKLAETANIAQNPTEEVLAANLTEKDKNSDSEITSNHHFHLNQNIYNQQNSAKKTVVLKSDEENPIIYIYKYPSTDSEVIGIAVAGDRYGYISTIGQWQEIKFNITTIGFVPVHNTEIEESDPNLN